ncbi:MAG TPA: O-antigen ligase family protein [Devosia sp.]|jgi:O-antigen ligase|nr:O-antigen ligase family protein [Devosia sp.]
MTAVANWRSRVDSLAVGAILLLTLTLSVVLGLVTPYLLIAIGVILLIMRASDGSWRGAISPAPLTMLAIVLALLASFAITAQAPADLLYIFNFVALVLFAPIYLTLLDKRPVNGAVIVGRLALLGALLSVVVMLVRIGYMGGRRSDAGLIGVIVLANTAMILGFLSLIGAAADHGIRRVIYLLGPVAGVSTLIMTQSRGPILALVPLGIAAAIFLARSLRINWWWVTAGLVAGVAATAMWVMSLGGRMARLPGIFYSMLSGDFVRDRTAEFRLDLYQAGWKAFNEAPLLGHGWARIMAAASPHLENRRLARLPQLHNDFLDFAVASGVVGIVLYLALLAAPIVLGFLSPRDSQRRIRLYGCTVLTVAYFFDGLTDLMFGFEFHTALYAVILAILLAYCRDREARP